MNDQATDPMPQTEASIYLTEAEAAAFKNFQSAEQANDESMSAFMAQWRRETARLNYERHEMWLLLADKYELDLENKVYRMNLTEGTVEFAGMKDDD